MSPGGFFYFSTERKSLVAETNMDDITPGASAEDSVSSAETTETSTETAPNPEAADANAGSESTESTEEFQFDADILAETDKIVAEAQAEADKTQSSVEKYLRKVISSKQMEVRDLSNKTPEYSETDRKAIDLYKGLKSYDADAGRPTSKPFVESLVKEDPDLAKQVGWELYTTVVNPDTGETVGHALLSRMGLDPNRLDDLRKFSRGEISGEAYGVAPIPETVPKEYGDAFKSLSKINRDNVLYNLDNGDDEERSAALETLRDRQDKLDFTRQKEQQERQSVETFQREVEVETDRTELETFTAFTDSFKETPTYTTAIVSGNPQLDGAIKNVVSMAILGTAYPGTVFGEQSVKLFKELGVEVDPAKIQELVSPVSSNIKTAVIADKRGHQSAKADAMAFKQESLDRLSGIRNRIFADAMTKLAGFMQAVSEGNGNILDRNGGIPRLEGNGHNGQNGQQQINTLDMVKQISAQLKSQN